MPSLRVASSTCLFVFLVASSACHISVNARLLAAERPPLPGSPSSHVEPESSLEAPQPSPAGSPTQSPSPMPTLLDSQKNGGVPPEWLRDSAAPPSTFLDGDVVVVSVNPCSESPSLPPSSGSSEVPQVMVDEPGYTFLGDLRTSEVPTASPAVSPSDSSESPSTSPSSSPSPSSNSPSPSFPLPLPIVYLLRGEGAYGQIQAPASSLQSSLSSSPSPSPSSTTDDSAPSPSLPPCTLPSQFPSKVYYFPVGSPLPSFVALPPTDTSPAHAQGPDVSASDTLSPSISAPNNEGPGIVMHPQPRLEVDPITVAMP